MGTSAGEPSTPGIVFDWTDEPRHHEVDITLIKRHHHKHDNIPIRASTFQFNSNRCLFKDAGGSEVFIHEFKTEVRRPWRDAKDPDRQVAFDWKDKDVFQLFICNPKKQVDGVPRYLFGSSDGYRVFQSELRRKLFVEEYDVQVPIDEGRGTDQYQVMKIWHSKDKWGNDQHSLTLPFRREGLLNIEEVEFDLFDCFDFFKRLPALKKRPDPLKVSLQFREPDYILSSKDETKVPEAISRPAERRSSKTSPRRRSSHKAESIKAGHFGAVHSHLFLHHKHLEVAFKTAEACKRFRDLHKCSKSVWQEGSPPTGRADSWSMHASGSSDTMSSTASSSYRQASSIWSQQDIEAHARSSLSSDFSPSQLESSPGAFSTAAQMVRSGHDRGDRASHERSTSASDRLSPLGGPPSLTLPEFSALSLDQSLELCRQGGPRAATVFQAKEEFRQNSRIYKRLQENDEIRLLRIRMGAYDEPLECKVEHVCLSNGPYYEAVSYCWGDAEDIVTIRINSKHRFQVSAHLLSGLKRLRCHDRDRLVWIDAVCINQNDIAEKNHQIPQMRNIYRKAVRTLIWIGNHHMTEPNCSRDYGDSEEGSDGPRTLCAVASSGWKEEEHVSLGDLTKNLEEFMVELHRTRSVNVWWKRLFVIQEFFHSQKKPIVYIGPHSIGWKHFDSLFPKNLSLGNPLTLFEEKKPPEKLFDLLCFAGSFHCGDHRDRVYGLLSLIPSTLRVISPDYGKSVLRVLEETCLFLIQDTKRVDVLLDGRLHREAWGSALIRGVFPTWIPDLTSLRSPKTWTSGGDSSGTDKAAEVQLLAEDSFDHLGDHYDRARSLKVKGIEFGKIARRTVVHDILPYEHYANNHLIYNSLENRGRLLDRILDKLEYNSKWRSKWEIEKSPRLGRLILDYLFETPSAWGQPHSGDGLSVVEAYKTQCQYDLGYLRDKGEETGAVEKRWELKIQRARHGEKFVPERMRGALEMRHTIIEKDFNLAREFENLFAYARTTKERYYFIGGNFDAPMMRDVLDCPTPQQAKKLDCLYELMKTGKPELPTYHEYNEKARERDFFITEDGVLGLGPSSLEVDDVVIVPYGSSRPWILRPCAGIEGTTYTLVGEAVVNELMSGKFLKRETAKSRDFVIR